MLSLRDVARKFFPPWMTDRQREGLTEGWKYIYGHMMILDLMIEFALEGVLARFPDFAPLDALPMIGRDRKIRRGLVETDLAYRARLKRWRSTWRAAGTAYEILWGIRNYLGVAGTLRVVNASGTWWTLAPDGSFTRTVTLPAKNWDWDGATLPARFWVILYASDYGWTEEGTWGDGTAWGDDGHGIGSTVPWRVVVDVRGIISDIKAGESVCQNVILSFDDAAFDPATAPGAPLPAGDWGDDVRVVSGVAVPPNRNTNAHYWSGVA